MRTHKLIISLALLMPYAAAASEGQKTGSKIAGKKKPSSKKARTFASVVVGSELAKDESPFEMIPGPEQTKKEEEIKAQTPSLQRSDSSGTLVALFKAAQQEQQSASEKAKQLDVARLLAIQQHQEAAQRHALANTTLDQTQTQLTAKLALMQAARRQLKTDLTQTQTQLVELEKAPQDAIIAAKKTGLKLQIDAINYEIATSKKATQDGFAALEKEEPLSPPAGAPAAAQTTAATPAPTRSGWLLWS